MAHPILMPKPGQMTEECTVVAWHKNEGDPVKRGDVLFEIESDKSNMEVEAFDGGVLLKRYVEEGQTVPVNALCAYVGEPGEAVPDEAPGMGGVAAAPASAATPAAAPAAATAVVPPATPAAVEAPATRPAAAMPATATRTEVARGDGQLRISPRASKLAATLGLDPRTIAGSGPEGRITEKDVRAAAETATAVDGSGARAGAVGPEAAETGEAAEAPHLSPRASRLAAAAGIDPQTIAGTGPDGRVTERDVIAALEAVTAAGSRPAAAGAGAARPALEAEPAEEAAPRPLSRMRRIIAERLTQSATTVPQFTVTVAVDMTGVLALRKELKAEGTSLTVTDFIVAAAAQTLVEFPDVNSRTDGESVWPRRRVHMGLAVALPAGLVVPVIRDADRRSIVDIHARSAELIEAARNGTLPPDEMTGSTFTISNLGMLGVDEFQAIINPGEAAILAVSSVVPTPVAVGDAIGIRQMMKVTLTSDHRLVDGELAARFLGALRRRLQDPDGLRADVLNG